MTIRNLIAAFLTIACLTAPLRAADELLCWKQTYTRGAGVIGKVCPAGSVNDAGLCYPSCPAGSTAVGPLCWQTCPAGFADIGVSCAKPKPEGRLGRLTENGCEAENGNGNCYKTGGFWYGKCPANFSNAGPSVCSPNCPSGMRDDGAFCAKTTVARGSVSLPSCGDGGVSDAGLCYPSCSSGFSGVGPVCWGTCPAAYPAQCGAGCAKSPDACALAVGDMALNTIAFATTILSMGLAGPGVGVAAKQAGKAVQTAAVRQILVEGGSTVAEKVAQSAAQKAAVYAKTFVQQMLKNQVNPANGFYTLAKLPIKGGLMSLNKASEEFGLIEETKGFKLTDLMALDITGASSMIYSFAKYPLCSGEPMKVSTDVLEFGFLNKPVAKTLRVVAQQPMTITRLVGPAMTNCQVSATADCIGKEMKTGQTCIVSVTLEAGANIQANTELRIYTDSYTQVPYAVNLIGSNVTDIPRTGTCTALPGGPENVNLTSITGAWALDNDQSRKIVVESTGAVQSWAGNGMVTVKDTNARTFEFKFGPYTNTPLVMKLDEQSTGLQGAQAGRTIVASKRPWSSSCPPGNTLVAGMCYDVPMNFKVTTPGFIGLPCPPDWRDDGTQCWPPWEGAKVAAQADPESSIYTMRHPMMVTQCGSYNGGNSCPANFVKATSGPSCTCVARPTSKDVRPLMGTRPIN